jgi:hypothetical protein
VQQDHAIQRGQQGWSLLEVVIASALLAMLIVIFITSQWQVTALLRTSYLYHCALWQLQNLTNLVEVADTEGIQRWAEGCRQQCQLPQGSCEFSLNQTIIRADVHWQWQDHLMQVEIEHAS